MDPKIDMNTTDGLLDNLYSTASTNSADLFNMTQGNDTTSSSIAFGVQWGQYEITIATMIAFGIVVNLILMIYFAWNCNKNRHCWRGDEDPCEICVVCSESCLVCIEIFDD